MASTEGGVDVSDAGAAPPTPVDAPTSTAAADASANTSAAADAAAAAVAPAQAAGSQRPAQVPQLKLAGAGGAGAGAGSAEGAGSDGAVGEKPEHLLEDAKEAKARGNEQFGQGKWQAAALDYHSACLLIDRITKDHPDASDATSEEAKALLVVCLTNLCQAQLKIGVADAAYKAACMATLMAPDNFKAWFLRSKTEETLGDVPAAYQSCVAAVKLKPRNATIRKRLVQLKKQKQRETRMVQRAFKGYFDGEEVAPPAEAAAAPSPAAAPASTPASAPASAPSGEAAGADGSSSSSDGETDDTSSSGDRYYQDRPADQNSDGEEVEYSDAAAYRKALDMGIPPDEAGAMVARGEGPILMAGYRSVAQYKESVEIKAQREGWAAERRAKRAKRRAKKAAKAAAAASAPTSGAGAGAGAGGDEDAAADA